MSTVESRAVRFERYGGVEVLEVVPVPRPEPGEGEVLVEVRAAGINPGEAAIREGRLHEWFPATFPCGQGSDLAGVVVGLGPGVERFVAGDEVLGFSDRRASHATHAVVPAGQLVTKPEELTWEEAGALTMAGATAHAALRAIAPRRGEVLLVAGAAGGVGSLAVQLARLRGVEVIGLAGEENHSWLAEHGVVPVDYHRDDRREHIRAAAARVDAFLDAHGDGYLEFARELGVPARRTVTTTDFAGARRYGTRAVGAATPGSPDAVVLAELADRVAGGLLELPIARTYRLDEVRAAYAELEHGHTRGKIVLVP